mmetsp:Transcript_15608/g.23708  ORF Transcript_15608/g.23708 Transcript_15608/m.23708 type:complete len:107 (+) Transcript_15608:580-900(+)
MAGGRDLNIAYLSMRRPSPRAGNDNESSFFGGTYAIVLELSSVIAMVKVINGIMTIRYKTLPEAGMYGTVVDTVQRLKMHKKENDKEAQTKKNAAASAASSEALAF